MLRKWLCFIMCTLFVSNVFALDCKDKDERLVLIPVATDIGYKMYDEKMHANKLTYCNGFRCERIYTGGEWRVINKESSDMNISGLSLCLDSDIYDAENNKPGPNCFCNVTKLDNYKILSDWVNVKEFEAKDFKQYKSKNSDETDQERDDRQSREACENKCSETCQSNLSKLIRYLKGFYTCDNALYKTSKLMCNMNKRFIDLYDIKVFDDLIELTLNKEKIIMRKYKDSDEFYETRYRDQLLYLKIIVTDNQPTYMFGNEKSSLTECSSL